MKHYIKFDPNLGYPGGEGIFYECLTCQESIKSNVKKTTKCRCGNLKIDYGASRFLVRDNDKLKIFKLKDDV